GPDRARVFTRAGRMLAFTTLGFGSAPLGNYPRPLSEADCDATLEVAWDGGMRYFDTERFYGFGLSENRVGHRPFRSHGLPPGGEPGAGICFTGIDPLKDGEVPWSHGSA
ncbi:MAG: hypothetical protein ACREO9_04265, partial [Lysobacterales bacterium]